ncbi:hypothetical protein HAX54_022448 [Datura stramonium]|uniref:Uncharacterized protein n=1 Tax=Datura stramonium TaxID=4076 RepID=A0ABS8UW53_DATST|nr:hypothetical protein [Datura stramonium]
MDNDDFGYEIAADDIRELSESDNMVTRESSKEYRNDDAILREMLNNLDCKLNLLEARCTKPDASFFAAAESMQKMLDEILKMKDPHQQREEENMQTMTDAVEKNLKDSER